MKRVFAMFSRSAAVPGSPSSPAGRLPTSDPPILKLPHLEGVKGAVGYALGGKSDAKRKVVCVHGLPGNVKDFRYLAWQLEHNGCEVLRVDLPGHASSHDAEVHGLPDAKAMAKAAYSSIVDVFGSSAKPLLVSHSMGAHVAWEMLQQQPDAFCGVVMVCPAGLRAHRSLQPWWLVRYFAEVFVTHPNSLLAKVATLFLNTAYQFVGFKSIDTKELILCQQRIGLIDYEGLKKDTIPEVMQKTSLPLHFAYSVDDPMCQPAVVEELVEHAKRFGGDRVTSEKYPTGGHAIQKWEAKHVSENCLAMFR